MERELRDSSFGAIHPAAIAAIRRQIALEDIPLHQTLMQAMNIAVARHNALFTKHASADERRVSEEFFRDIEAILNRRRSV